MRNTPVNFTPTMISEFCRARLARVSPPRVTEAIRLYLLDHLEQQIFPPYRGKRIDIGKIAVEAGIEAGELEAARDHLQPIFDSLSRALVKMVTRRQGKPKALKSQASLLSASDSTARCDQQSPEQTLRRARKSTSLPVHPEPLFQDWEDTDDFTEALNLHIRRHDENPHRLWRAIEADAPGFHVHTLRDWCRGARAPATLQSMAVLTQIEQRYRLPEGYFRSKLSSTMRAPRGQTLKGMTPSERRRLVWHLPDDFSARPAAEQEEILAWVRTVIIHGSTDYRRYQAAAAKQRYAVRFRALLGRGPRTPARLLDELDVELGSGTVDAPPQLEAEMGALLHFKTSTLTAFGLQRSGVWGTETASQKTEHFGLLFGALAASPRSAARGYGADLNSLTFAVLVFPAVWDWYLQWRERRRGFYTQWELDMLNVAIAFVREETGWLRQNPTLADALLPITGLVSENDIAVARSDWDGACDQMHKHGRHRAKEIQRICRVHRDPFEPILPVLEATSPVGEYRKITEEIVRRMPDERRHPRAAAEAVRSFLLLRLGLHLGLRQKNLREMRVCLAGRAPLTERQLEDLKCGELRWSPRDAGWEVLIPAVAFKNANSSFFGSKPFRLVLPDLGGLNAMIDAYLSRHRKNLLGSVSDPGTFFVKSVKRTSTSAAYDQTTFYEAWRLTIQRYGIYNPYTRRGAIEGLLPHGPHNVRDVLATHILKQTGSYEQASYAIQDTAEMVAKHYGRFLPQDKAAIAAQILNRVWEAA